MELIPHYCKYCGDSIFRKKDTNKKNTKKNLYECKKCYYVTEIFKNNEFECCECQDKITENLNYTVKNEKIYYHCKKCFYITIKK